MSKDLSSNYPPAAPQSGTALSVYQYDDGTKGGYASKGGIPPSKGWMDIPRAPLNCPPGLEYLTLIDQLFVNQKINILEVMTGFEMKNKFSIRNSLGEKIYYAIQDSDFWSRSCFGPMRPFDMKILDKHGNEVIHLNRPLACDFCLFPCCLPTIVVSAPPDIVVGIVKQKWTMGRPLFRVNNPLGETVFLIKGPLCAMRICRAVDFKVLSADQGTQIGKISKHWSGWERELLSDADNFGITFPMSMDVRMKAVMLGVCILIDAMFFESSSGRDIDL